MTIEILSIETYPAVPACEICDQDQADVPGMVLARWHEHDICTDCLTDGPPMQEYREQLAVWEEKFLPITRCPWCQQLTRTAQDPQGSSGACRRCLREHDGVRNAIWQQICSAMRADDRSTLARLERKEQV